MKVLFLGDVVAAAGRDVIRQLVPSLKVAEKIDLVVANGENAAGGLGIEEKSATDLFQSGVDVITGGNHSWDKKEVYDYINKERRLIRPANYPNHPLYPVPGKGFAVIEVKNAGPSFGKKLGIINLMGRIHMDPMDCPFVTADLIIEKFFELNVHCILVDIHAEATSEKQALAHYLSGRVSAVFGSHTHVQTADERLLTAKNGFKTAYITDAGMNGPYDSVIGMVKERSIVRFLSKMPQKYEPAEKMAGLHGVIIEINDATGEAQSIKRISQFI